MNELRLGTRRSPLAMYQANLIADLLRDQSLLPAARRLAEQLHDDAGTGEYLMTRWLARAGDYAWA